MTTKVRDVMTNGVVSVLPTATFKEVAERLVDLGVSGLPVVDTDGTLLGVVTEADLMSKEAFGPRRRHVLSLVTAYLQGHDPRWLHKAAVSTAGDLMSTDPTTATPDERVDAAARRMLDLGVKRLPVVENGRLVGIVTRRDLLRSFVRSDDDIAKEVAARLCSPRFVPEDHHLGYSVADGIVTLTGSVHFPSHLAVVEGVIRGIPGVVDVVRTELTVEEPEPRLHGVQR